MKTTITATSPRGRTMLWSDQGWSPNLADALDYRSQEAAQLAIRTQQPFVGLLRLGWQVQTQETRL